jgi:hypothetical protein
LFSHRLTYLPSLILHSQRPEKRIRSDVLTNQPSVKECKR